MKKNLLLFIVLLSSQFVKAQTNDKFEAMQLVTKNIAAIGLSNADLANSIVSDSYNDRIAGTRMVYLQQSFRDIPVYNQLLVLAFKNGKLVSKAGQFIASIDKKVNTQNGIPAVTPEAAVNAAIRDRKLVSKQAPVAIAIDNSKHKIEFGDLGVSRQNITAELTWVPLSEGKTLVLAWQVYIIPQTTPDYWMVRVDATNNGIVGVDNYTVYCNWDLPENKDFFSKHINKTADINAGLESNLFDFRTSSKKFTPSLTNSPAIVNNASFRVIPFPAESPSHPGGAHALVANPWTMTPGNATSLNWNSNGTTDYSVTRGNNVNAQEDQNNNNGTGFSPTSTTSPDLTFNFIPNFTVAATQSTPVQNQQFNITNLFYWNNLAHDITYQYGFDEVSGNFQDNNQGRGGLGSDNVNADAQDGGGTNNANFSTPADGQRPRMQMYLWNGNPQKDGDVDNGVVIHEFGHGISNRLTGGPSQSGCLGSAEQMGEGWSDYYCLMYTQDWANSNLNTGFTTPRPVGTYVIGQSPAGSGIRNQKYCTNFNVNNLVYGTSISGESHNRGEIWCAALWDMTWNIINQVGTINPNIYNPAAGGGNAIALQLVTMGIKLQPCSPGFIDGRDAILQADQILYNGLYECAIREAFRRRGMGAFASQGSSASVTDQTPDYSLGGASFTLTQAGMTEVPEGGFITYTNTVTTSGCAPIANFLLTDTLPLNVTYVSGGSYNSTTRVVSFPVNMAAAQSQQYSFTVQVNAGAYYPTINLFEDNVTSATVPPAIWTTNSTTTTNWEVTNTRSHTAPSSYFSLELDVTSDQKIYSTNFIALGATPPPLTFWHLYNLESTYDGGVLEISTDGTVWTDLQPHILTNGYTATMDASTLLAGRRAWTGSSNNKFIKTKVDLSTYANQSVKIRFRMISDVGTNPEGWYIDDIAVKDQAVVEMTSNFFTQAGVKVAISDTVTIITPPPTCAAVSITSQVTNANVCSGNDAAFTISANGDTPSYQWQVSTDGGLNFVDIPGATTANLSVTGVTAGMNNNQYHVVISNACPSNITSNNAILTVSDPASITAQPTDLSACAGTDGNFIITASGTANSYQWQVSTDGGTSFTDIVGATAASLTLTGVTATMNNNQYHVVVSSCSPAPLTSANVTLTVNSPASITAQPVNVTACETTDATFTAQVDGTNVAYQWQVSTDGGTTFTDIPATNSASLTISPVTAAQNNNQYHVVVSNICTASFTSSNATLTVSNSASITTQPVSNTACEGSNISFTATASGTGYQWEVSTDGVTFIPVPGATNPVLDLSTVTIGMNGNQYHLVVLTCGPNAVVSNNVTLTVVSPAAITSQPATQDLCEGANATFTVSTTGTAISYQWEFSTDNGVSYNPVPAATLATLSITGVTVAMDGYLYRVVLNNFCSVNFTSDAAILRVSSATAINTAPADQTTCEGTDVNFSVAATGTSTGLSYQWQVSTDGGINFTDISGQTGSSLSLSSVTASMNNNRYRVIVTGCNSVTSTGAILVVNPSPSVVISVSPYLNLTTDLTTTLTATANPPTTSFSWFKNDVLVAGATTNTLNVSYADLGAYKASVTDANGCSKVSNIITIADSVVNIAFIYPNPNTGFFQVRYQGVEFNGQPRIITLFDAKGARVLQQSYATVTSYQIMDVHGEHLSSGVYALILSDASGKTLGTGKVVIRR
ncbi:MAG: M36 family metallopeptidase [Ferruginibacter sp.]